MKSVDCDQVFEILTSGPFPTGGATDDAVESHLAECSACRRLAEALAPALDLIHESLRPDESAGLPEYWGEFSGLPTDARREPASNREASSWEASLDLAATSPVWELLRAEMVAAQQCVAASTSAASSASVSPAVAPAETPRPRFGFSPALRWAVVAALVLVATFAGRWSVGLIGAGSDPQPIAAASVRTPENVEWDALGVSLACRDSLPTDSGVSSAISGVAVSDSVPHATGSVRCCTHCHAAGKATTTKSPSKLLLAQACVLCHLSMP
ncbi:MAG TPA: hypothetical protein VGE52_06980 [Pirellulales bacterium]